MALSDIKFIAIDGQELPRPRDFAPQMTDIYAGEYTTCTGKLVGDRIGWKYGDMTLSWDALTQAQVDVLINMAGAAALEFEGPDGYITTEQIIRDSTVQLRNRNTIRGEVLWKNVSVSIRFIDAHND